MRIPTNASIDPGGAVICLWKLCGDPAGGMYCNSIPSVCKPEPAVILPLKGTTESLAADEGPDSVMAVCRPSPIRARYCRAGKYHSKFVAEQVWPPLRKLYPQFSEVGLSVVGPNKKKR